MDEQFERRINECDVKLDNCKTRIANQKESGEDMKFLKQRLTNLNVVRAKLVKGKANAS